MITYYCDGSQYNNKIGVGIAGNSIYQAIETDCHNWRSQVHEIVAITKAIEKAVKLSDDHIRIVNDDKHLINAIRNKLQGKRTTLEKKDEFIRMMNLIEHYRVIVDTPKNEKDKKQIKKCHELSRKFLNKF